MGQELFEWIWLALFVVMIAVRKLHERAAGRRTSLKGIPVLEAATMLLWGLAAGVLPLLHIFTDWLEFADYPFAMPPAFQAVGAFVFVLAIWLLHRSHTDLGKRWSPTVEFEEQHTLVAEGVYRHVRHPMYAAHLIWGVAQSVLLPNFAAGLSALILILPVILLRIRREERAMLGHFGDAYRQYMVRTGRLLPKW